MSRYRFCCSLAVVALCTLGGIDVCASGSDTDQRAFQVDDLFELEAVGMYYGGPYAFSADGQELAITRVRPKKTLANHKWEFLWGNAGGDIWVQMSPSEPLVNITNGIQDGSGWWSPQWSPDGQKLAMLSTRGGNVRLWVWDVPSKHLRQLTTRGVDSGPDTSERPYVWIDSDHILCPVLPEGDQPSGMKVELQTPTIASAQWPKVPKGDDSTASVLQSGVPAGPNLGPQGELLLLSVPTGAVKIVAQGTFRFLRISPNRRAVAFTRQTSIYRPKPTEHLGFDTAMFSGLATVGLVALDGSEIAIHGRLGDDILEDSLRWSPDGDELVYFGYDAGRDKPPLLYRVNLRTQGVSAESLKDLDPVPPVRESSQIEWTATGDLLLRAAKHAGDQKPDVATRRDWWLLKRDGTPKCLTAELKTPPRELWPQEGRKDFVGIGENHIWRLETEAGKVENVTAKFEAKVDRISWPSMTNQGTNEYRIPGATYSQLVFSIRESDALNPYLLDLHSGQISRMERPAPKASLVAYDPTSAVAIFYATDRNGLHIWRTDVRTQKTVVLVTANDFLQNVAEGEYKPVEYTSLNGEKLKGWVLLPHGFVAGKRYPVIAWVYPGIIYGDRSPNETIDDSGSLNLQILAANGYAVLFPSMPLAKEGLTEDPLLRLPEGVLPAVEKAIEMGIADPERLFLMGQSFGGFATYGLVTQTQRFKAAVALAGLSDLISLYGQFDARRRYTDNANEYLSLQALMESAQIGMGNPPWKDLGRYIRNSPVFYVDRVQTPVMIIQGDLDYVAMQQGEEFFMSLYRQGKRAEFVRYWGEGHVLESPANIRDMWKHIFAWFEEFSPKN